jgi:hypothetical protein
MVIQYPLNQLGTFLKTFLGWRKREEDLRE